ncbi:cell wall hydrolase [Nibricoccus aquaticus]|uniref:N-acetylmuramoyl-L-alanine amidase n=1 Tax=Nibricoccus aquaticus TaxID=2576891 RepID=A0A290QHM2_9BACT|nr:cell wall hydrolase [Nibricoccus aquaticus]
MWWPAYKKLRTLVAIGGLLAVLGGQEVYAIARSTPSRPAAGGASASSAAGVVKLGGIDYVDAAAFGKKAGLKAVWIKAGERLSLRSDTTRVDLEVDSREVMVNGVRVFMGEGARLHKKTVRISKIDAERLLLPIVRPASVTAAVPQLRVIALDAGHGGRDPGKENKKLRVNEKTFTLDVVKRAEKLLTQQGYKVVLTRKSDTYAELGDRPAAAARAGADLFISVHFNAVAANVERVSGTETYTMTPQYQRSASDSTRDSMDAIANPGNVNDHWNALLGYHMQRAMLADLKTSDRGLKRGRLAVLRLATCPAVLVEAGFLSNTSEAKKIATAEYRQKIADAIADGVKAYAAALATARK